MENNGIMNSVNAIVEDMNSENAKQDLNSIYGALVPTTTDDTAIVENNNSNDISAIINGDITNSFNVIATRGNFSARESYAVTRPDSDDDNTISIGKQARNEIVDIDRFIIYSFENDGAIRVGICIFGANGKKYVTTSTAFIKEFVLLDRLYKMDNEVLNKIKIIHKESKNKTPDGQKMYYPLPIGL